MMIRLMYFCKIVFICCYLFSDKFNAIWSFKVTNADKQICAKILYETWWNFDRRDVYLDRCIFVISFISRDFVYLTIMKMYFIHCVLLILQIFIMFCISVWARNLMWYPKISFRARIYLIVAVFLQSSFNSKLNYVNTILYVY